MRIAFISDEFPPDTAGGGIGTYLEIATKTLSDRGHDVSVFSKANGRVGKFEENGVTVFRVDVPQGERFSRSVSHVFKQIHAQKTFNVIEGNDFLGSAVEIKRQHPALPYVVKLHTPLYVVEELHQSVPRWSQRLRMHVGAWRRGTTYRPYDFRFSENAQLEMEAIRLADSVASPSEAIGNRIAKDVGIENQLIEVFPYCFEPSRELLGFHIPSDFRRIGFVGRLEQRKGAIDLANAFALLADQNPHVTLTMIGRDMPKPNRRCTVGTEIRGLLERHSDRVTLTGVKPHSLIPSLIAECDIMVFPSHWESFGLVCCEAMAAGRVVVGSNSGGMREILDNGNAGFLVDPHSPKQIAEAIDTAVSNRDSARKIALLGRERVLSWCSPDAVYSKQLACYEKAIAACNAKNPAEVNV